MQTITHNGLFMSYIVKAFRYDQIKGKTDVAKKRVLKIPKIMRSGTKKSEKRTTSADSTDRVDILYGKS